jgi:hypothetical protein
VAQIVWRDLVDVVVEPVDEQQVAMAAPGGARFILRIALREIVMRQFRTEASFHIAEIFIRQRVSIVFRVSGYKSNTFIFAGKQVGIALFCFGQNLQIRVVADQCRREIRIAGVRSKEDIIKTACQQRVGMKDVVLIHTGELSLRVCLGMP